MPRDYTKYNVEGLGENLNKRVLVFTIVKDYVEKNNPSFEDLQKAFPDEVQGSKGFIRKESDVKNPKQFNMREPLKIKNGAHVVVSNQWGENINDFIAQAKSLGFTIVSNTKEEEEEKSVGEDQTTRRFKIHAGARHAPRPMQVLAVPPEIYTWLKNQGIDIANIETGFDLQNFPQDVQKLLKENVPFTLPDSEDDDSYYPGDDYFNYYTGANVVHELIGIPLSESGYLNGYLQIVDENENIIADFSGANVTQLRIRIDNTLETLKEENDHAQLLFYSVEGDGVALDTYEHDACDDEGYFERRFNPADLELVCEDFGWFGRFVTDFLYQGESISPELFNLEGTDGGPWFSWECEKDGGNTWKTADNELTQL